MSKPMRGLGKGLDALIPNAQSDAEKTIQEFPVTEIRANRFQPRMEFDDESLEELVQSIRQYGVLQPVLVRKTLQGYELIAGERRLRASKQAGLETIPAIVREYTDSEMTEVALIENLQREDLTAIEEALAYNKLLTEFGLTQEEVAKKVGRSRSHIANFVRLLGLPKIVQDYVSRGTLSMGQARPLLVLQTEQEQIEAAEYIIAEELSARESEKLVKKLFLAPFQVKKSETEEQEAPQKEIFVAEVEERLKMFLGTQVKIKPGKVKSKIEIEFYSEEDLERILETLTTHSPQSMKSKIGTFHV